MPDVAPLARLDSFPYRHRLAEVMVSLVTTAETEMPLRNAVGKMVAEATSALVVTDPEGRVRGIVTEGDVLKALASHGDGALALPLAAIMSSPVERLAVDHFLYVAMARLARRNIRHLPVVDENDRPIGMVTGESLMAMRSNEALLACEAVSEAPDSRALARITAAMPGLAGGLLAEGLRAAGIAQVISALIRDISARAGDMTEQTMATDGWGPPPAPYALLVLGSAGRGESLLAFDQDNALVHADQPGCEPWFAEFGKRFNQLLNDAGLPFCPGEVMVRNPLWRRSRLEWEDEIRRWVFEPAPQSVLAVDIFFDLRAVHGDFTLAQGLCDEAIRIAASSAFFQQFLAINVARMESPLGPLGGFRRRRGRVNAKKHALLPLVSAARAKALKAGLQETGTIERYQALERRGLLHADDLAGLTEAHEIILSALLRQQLKDLAENRPASAEIDPAWFTAPERDHLKEAFRRVLVLKTLITNL